MTAGNGTPTPTRGVPVELGGRTRHFRYTLKTLREIREKFGAKALEEGVADTALAEVMYMGLRADDPELTVEALEEMIDLPDLPAVLDAMKKAMGGKAKVVEASPPPPAPATGAAGASA